MGSNHGWGALMWLGMGLGSLVILGVVALVVVLLVQGLGHNRNRALAATVSAAPPTPLQILDERLARGDLTEEEYRRRRDLLLGG